jgi:hypothetical protein
VSFVQGRTRIYGICSREGVMRPQKGVGFTGVGLASCWRMAVNHLKMHFSRRAPARPGMFSASAALPGGDCRSKANGSEVSLAIA